MGAESVSEGHACLIEEGEFCTCQPVCNVEVLNTKILIACKMLQGRRSWSVLLLACLSSQAILNDAWFVSLSF